MNTKICTGCGIEKDINEFTWSLKGIKRHPRCNACRGEERKERYERNKEHELAYKFDRQQRKREEARAYVWEYLKTHPCEHCHETDPLVLTFHHVRGKKKKNVAELVNQGYLIEVIREEIEKCIVLCGNCHMREEKRIRGTNYPSG